MAPHSSTLAWKNPWTEKSGGLQSMGCLTEHACMRVIGKWVGSNKLVKLKTQKQKKPQVCP